MLVTGQRTKRERTMGYDRRWASSLGAKAARIAGAAAVAWSLAAPTDADAVLLTTPLPAGIPTGTSSADNLVVDFQILFANPLPDGAIFSFELTTGGFDPGENVVVDLYGDLGGQGFLGTAYSGQFTELSTSCRVGSELCAALIDGQFSVGLRMTGGAALLTSYTVTAWIPKGPAPATTVPVAANDAPEPGTLPLTALALTFGALALRRAARDRVSVRPRA
jgi:hypothetical protein